MVHQYMFVNFECDEVVLSHSCDVVISPITLPFTSLADLLVRDKGRRRSGEDQANSC